MLDAENDHPPHDVSQALRAFGPTAPDNWTRLRGGRTNRLWTFHSGDGVFVCKLYSGVAATPLFPNDASAEAAALQALAGTGLAPQIRQTLFCPSGPVLIYEHVENTGPHAPHETAKALARLHARPVPAGLRQLASEPQAILTQGDAMLQGVIDARAAQLQRLRPAPPADTPFERVFLHGDPVPANVVQAANGPCFIDWQCPAVGDPTEDLALYLSPAMQHLYGGNPLNHAQTAAFLGAYGSAKRAARCDRLARLFHWRMAAYCLWKVARGDADYSAAADLEIARLKEFG